LSSAVTATCYLARLLSLLRSSCPLNLIAGLFGMNVHVPGQDAGGLGWWFGIVGVILTFSAVCVGTMKKLNYI
jgi:magnesium transporter